MVIRYLITFFVFLNSILLSAQVEFMPQEGIPGEIIAAWADTNATLHCIGKDASGNSVYYAFDLKSNRILYKTPLAFRPDSVAFDKSLLRFYLLADHWSAGDSCTVFNIRERKPGRAKIPAPDTKRTALPEVIKSRDALMLNRPGKK